jgi:hypothetical protein
MFRPAPVFLLGTCALVDAFWAVVGERLVRQRPRRAAARRRKLKFSSHQGSRSRGHSRGGSMPALADLFKTYYLSGQSSVDFASIRLHYTGADSVCRPLHARAFTVGTDIYFADGAFAPRTRAGLWLLAHEVAHVVQQSAGGMSASGPRPRSRERHGGRAAGRSLTVTERGWTALWRGSSGCP